MVNYYKSKIYTIRCKSNDALIYVGSTTQPLNKRWIDHKSKAKEVPDRLIYKIINNEWDFWYIELYEIYPCENKEQLLKKEGEVIRNIGTLNKIISARTQTEYYNDNKEILKECMKQNYENNKEERKENIRMFRKCNPEIMKERDKIYYQNNKEKKLEQHKKWEEKNKEILKEKRKEYYKQNKVKILEKVKKIYKNKKNINITLDNDTK